MATNIDSDVKPPSVGEGGTVLHFSDTTPCTIVEVNGNEVVTLDDRATVTGGKWPDCTYRYESDPEGRRRVFTLRSNGVWAEKGRPARIALRLVIGERRYYRDPSF